MSKKRDRNKGIEGLNLNGDVPVDDKGLRQASTDSAGTKAGGRRWLIAGVIAFLAVGALGAGLKFMDDSARAERKLGVRETSLIGSLNPFSMPSPTPTPQLSKELIYAGSRLLAVEDKNATAVPPADLAIWRPTTGRWWVRISGSQWIEHGWGVNGDAPVPGDYDGDGTTDFSVWRPSDKKWYVFFSSTPTFYEYQFGEATDTPAPADYS